jgi:hypothetical protein
MHYANNRFLFDFAKSEENVTAFLDTAEETLSYHKCGSEMVSVRKRD